MFCSNCGKEIQEGSLYCSFCGQEQNKKVQKNINKNIVIGIIAYIGYICCLTIYLYGNARYIERQHRGSNIFNYQDIEKFDYTYFSLMLFGLAFVLPMIIYFLYNKFRIKNIREVSSLLRVNKSIQKQPQILKHNTTSAFTFFKNKVIVFAKKFFAGLVDRIMILLVFAVITEICFGSYLSSSYVGKYTTITIEGQRSIYPYMEFNAKHSKPSDFGVTESYQALVDIEQAEHGLRNYGELDDYMTTIFVLSNILYLIIAGCFLNSTLGERLCRLRTVDKYGDLVEKTTFWKKGFILGIVLVFFVTIRNLVDTTYLIVSIVYLLINCVLLLFTQKSLVDILSNSKVVSKKDVNVDITTKYL